MLSPLPWKLDEHDPSKIYDANGKIIAEDYRFLHINDFERIPQIISDAMKSQNATT